MSQTSRTGEGLLYRMLQDISLCFTNKKQKDLCPSTARAEGAANMSNAKN